MRMLLQGAEALCCWCHARMATVHAVFHTVLLLTMPNCLLNLLHGSGAEQDLYLQWPVTLEGQERQHQQSLQPD